jgi:hypothetical protein
VSFVVKSVLKPARAPQSSDTLQKPSFLNCRGSPGLPKTLFKTAGGRRAFKNLFILPPGIAARFKTSLFCCRGSPPVQKALYFIAGDRRAF